MLVTHTHTLCFNRVDLGVGEEDIKPLFMEPHRHAYNGDTDALCQLPWSDKRQYGWGPRRSMSTANCCAQSGPVSGGQTMAGRR